MTADLPVLTVLSVFGGYPGTQITGAERMAWRTTAALARRGHRAAALSDSRPPDDLADRSWPVVGSVGAWRSAGLPRPDVVHVYDLASPEHARTGYDMARDCGARLAVTPASDPRTWPDPELGRRLCLAADTVFVLTGAEEAHLLGLGVPRHRVSRIPQAPDLAGSGDGTGFRNRHAIRGPLVLFLGRHVRSKGFDLLLDAAPSVWERFPGTVFAFAGPPGGPEAAELFRAHRDERILALGMLPDAAKHDALRACDVLALPTSADVFPLVFAEAWSCGKPILSGRFPGSAEVVRDGVDGVLVDHTAHSVSAALLRLLGDDALRGAMGRAGRVRARTELSWDRVAAAVEQACVARPPDPVPAIGLPTEPEVS